MLGAVCYRPEVDMSQGSWKSYVNPQKWQSTCLWQQTH
jgi:hypothetical protein